MVLESKVAFPSFKTRSRNLNEQLMTAVTATGRHTVLKFD
jgi:hypothetical protein